MSRDLLGSSNVMKYVVKMMSLWEAHHHFGRLGVREPMMVRSRKTLRKRRMRVLAMLWDNIKFESNMHDVMH